MPTFKRVTERQYTLIQKQRNGPRPRTLLTKTDPSRAMILFEGSSTTKNKSVVTIICIILLKLAAHLFLPIYVKIPVVPTRKLNFDAHLATNYPQLFCREYSLNKPVRYSLQTFLSQSSKNENITESYCWLCICTFYAMFDFTALSRCKLSGSCLGMRCC